MLSRTPSRIATIAWKQRTPPEMTCIVDCLTGRDWAGTNHYGMQRPVLLLFHMVNLQPFPKPLPLRHRPRIGIGVIYAAAGLPIDCVAEEP